MRRRLVAALCVALSSILVMLALRADPTSSESPASSDRIASGASTPAWSPRRLPAPFVDAVASARLRAEVADALAGSEACVLVEGPSGRIVDLDGTLALVPASTIKILTAIGALASLPEDFRFTTTVAALGPVDGSTVAQVALVGDADPLLATSEWIAAREADPMLAGTPMTPLATLADGVTAAGVRSIPGGVVGVAPRWYDEPAYLPGWPETYRRNAIGPLSSLVVDAGFRAPGEPAADPALHAAEELTRLLRERGVEVGEPSTANEPIGAAVLASVDSVQLPEIVGAMLATSDNLIAEILVREIAVANSGSSTADGVAIIREHLAALGLTLDGLDQHDGSGLSRESRASCSLLDAALEIAERPDLAAVRDGLAVAGELGTLAPRLSGTPLEGRLVAKTGTLPGVTGLVGYLEVGPPLRFALLANGDFSEEAALALREEVARILARYPDAPPPDDLVSVP